MCPNSEVIGESSSHTERVRQQEVMNESPADHASDQDNDEDNVGLYRNVRIIDLNLSVGITNPRRLNLIFIYIL